MHFTLLANNGWAVQIPTNQLAHSTVIITPEKELRDKN